MISLGLVGYPLKHSLSPRIQKAALDYCGLEGSYSLYPIPHDDLQNLKNLLDQVRDSVITGLNVTIPHKQNIILFLDELTPVAKAIGAVNTIYQCNGKLMGDNTDAPGFLGDLKRILVAESIDRGIVKKALVLGAGGAARAVTYALLNDGWNVAISARRVDQAEELIGQFSVKNSPLTRIDYDANGFRAHVLDLFLVINTTPIGMSGTIGESPWPEGIPFPPHSIIYDLIYNPRETKLIMDARSAGLRAFNGLGMLVEQAVLSFKIWTGFEVPRELIYSEVEEK
jgi:shikimate dehydrogenase